MEQKIAPKKTIVLKPQATVTEIQDVANKKKTGLYGTVFTRPKPDEIGISSIDLYYEPYWIIQGEYRSEYFRKNIYEFSTDPEVMEVIIGNGKFPVRTESGTWNKIRSSMKVGERENKLDIPVEEHVEYDIKDEIVLNSQGNEVKFKYKINSKNVENFPEDVLKNNESNVRPSVLNQDQVAERLIKLLQEDIANEEVRMVKETLVIDKLEQVYIPVYEARCVDSKNKIQVLRIDGMDLKTL